MAQLANERNFFITAFIFNQCAFCKTLTGSDTLMLDTTEQQSRCPSTNLLGLGRTVCVWNCKEVGRRQEI